ncbi:hypothetical protein [Methanococcus maripaludis]|nr:hypothetical protein [Methanococcus maripaludis]
MDFSKQKIKFAGNGRVSWLEFIFSLFGTAVMYDIIYLQNTYISDFWTSVLVEIGCMVVVLLSGKRNFKKSKSISGVEGLGIGFLLVIIYVFGILQVEALMIPEYQIVALFFTGVLYFAIAMRD